MFGISSRTLCQDFRTIGIKVPEKSKILDPPFLLAHAKGVCPDLLATSGDYLRIWKVNDQTNEVKLESLLNNVRDVFLIPHPCYRHLEHSTIIYEDSQQQPLLRLAWNKQDPNYLATMATDGLEVIILDVRVPCTPVATLKNHTACVNGIAWAPHSSCHICSAADDQQALIWDIQQMPRPIDDPILAYKAEGEINQVQWATGQPDWIAICYNQSMEILRV
eukprot:sb/3469867/